MAKRGETRPWRVRFAWENGAAGVSTHRSMEDAEREARKIRAASGNAPSALLSCTVEHRDHPGKPITCGDCLADLGDEHRPDCLADEPPVDVQASALLAADFVRGRA